MTRLHEENDVYGRTARSYDRIATDYAARHDSLDEIRDLLNEFASSLPRGGVILDAGCGHGRDAEYFTKLGFTVIGVDYSNGLLDLAKDRAPRASFAASDVRMLPFRGEVFDGVWMNAVLHHLLVDDIRLALRESRRVLKDRGKFYASFHLSSKEGWDGKYGEHQRFFSGATKDVVAHELDRSGLTTTRTLTRSSEDRWFHWFAECCRVPAAHGSDE